MVKRKTQKAAEATEVVEKAAEVEEMGIPSVARGVDFSEGENLSDGTLFKWARDGVTRLYIQYSAKLAHYLEKARDFVLRVPDAKTDVYTYLYFPRSPWNQTPEGRVRATLDIIAASGADVRYVWLDLEDPNDTGTPDEIIQALLRCGELIESRGYKPGIYTGRSSYISRVGSYTGFADRGWPLWHANYVHGLDVPPEPDLSLEPETVEFGNVSPYGGWVRPLIRQWHGTTMFGGHSVDMDIEGDAVIPGSVPEGEEDDMKFILPEPGMAEWWSGRQLVNQETFGTPYSEMKADLDLHAQPGDVARFAVQVNEGEIVFYHGETELIAGIADPGFNEVEAKVSDKGIVRFIVRGADAEVDGLYSLGNWR